MDSLTWRDTRAYVDDWMFVKNESRYDEMVERMVSFREKTRKLWEFSDGSERPTWMTPIPMLMPLPLVPTIQGRGELQTLRESGAFAFCAWYVACSVCGVLV